MRTLTILLSFLILVSCGNTKLKVAEVQSLELEYSPDIDLNYSLSFKGKVKAITHDGKEFDVTNNRKFELQSKDISQSGSEFTIVKHPITFHDSIAEYVLLLTDKEESFKSSGSLRMNFRGGLNFQMYGDKGADGVDQKDRGTPFLLRDGNNGDDGTIGGSGGNAGNLEVKIWKEGSYYYFIVHDLNSVMSDAFYKSEATAPLSFILTGGKGGKGGNGGDGGTGKDGIKKDDGKIKRPGDGGNGGNGGNGGDGGDGGNIHFIIHSNAADISNQLKYTLTGGMGGEGGLPGKAGLPGDPLQGQVGGNKGTRGVAGQVGNWGKKGTANIEFVDFDFTIFHQ